MHIYIKDESPWNKVENFDKSKGFVNNEQLIL